MDYVNLEQKYATCSLVQQEHGGAFACMHVQKLQSETVCLMEKCRLTPLHSIADCFLLLSVSRAGGTLHARKNVTFGVGSSVVVVAITIT